MQRGTRRPGMPVGRWCLTGQLDIPRAGIEYAIRIYLLEARGEMAVTSLVPNGATEDFCCSQMR